MRWFRTFVRTWLVALLLTVVMSACGQEPTTQPAVTPGASEASPVPLQRLYLPMGYIPNIQFAPFYMAVERGYFRQAGFEVEFDYSFETDGLALVAAGEIPFAIVSGEQVLLARAQGLPVVYVAAWWQKFPVAVIADAELGLQSPADLKGQTIGLPGLFGASYIGLNALLYSVGLTENDVTLEAIGFNQVEAFATGKQQVVVGYITNEPIQLRYMGFQITVFPVADYVTLVSNGIITNEQYLREQPERVRAFVNAFLLGLRDTIDHPGNAYETSMAFVENLEPDDPVQQEVLSIAIDYWYAQNLGYASWEAWENMQEVLLRMKLLEAPVDLEAVFTNEYLPSWAKEWRK